LNDHLLQIGGHIGDMVRPSERRKGYGTEQIRLALEKCRELGIPWVLVTCDKDNIASARTIQKNGGVLENEVMDADVVKQRYWIDCTD
jgi:predicted acetyltransferase